MKVIGDTIELYWDDLCTETQKELEKMLGDNGNYDVFPIAILDFYSTDNMMQE